MKYTLQQLDKAAIIINQVKELDASIIALEALADKVLNHNIVYNLKVSGNITKENKEVILDSDGSLKRHGDNMDAMFSRMIFGSISMSNTKKSEDTLLDINLSDSNMLAILGVLIESKYQQREVFKQSIRELGIEI